MQRSGYHRHDLWRLVVYARISKRPGEPRVKGHARELWRSALARTSHLDGQACTAWTTARPGSAWNGCTKANRITPSPPPTSHLSSKRFSRTFSISTNCYGDLPVDIPRVVVAHGDLITWWVAVHGREPKAARWLSRYRDVVGRGLSGSATVVAPSAFMLDALRASYAPAPARRFIYNGRNPIFFNPYVSKEDSVLSVGRLLDAGKQVHLLTQHEHPLSVCIVGSDNPVNAPRIPIRADVKVSTDQLCVSLKGPQTEAQLRSLYSRAAVYAATARYEPFGMETPRSGIVTLRHHRQRHSQLPRNLGRRCDLLLVPTTRPASPTRSANLAKTARSAGLMEIVPTSVPAIATTTSA